MCYPRPYQPVLAHQEFLRNVKREFAKLQVVLQAYAIISTKVRSRSVPLSLLPTLPWCLGFRAMVRTKSREVRCNETSLTDGEIVGGADPPSP